jgi:hypothetical protein
MTHQLEPFTPEEFKKVTGLNAADNEAIYLRWVNTQINYATYQTMQEMTKSLKVIIDLLKENSVLEEKKYPFTK